MKLEEQGIPTITLGTYEFENLAKLQARSMGHPDLRLVFITHPLGGIPAEEASKKARAAVDDVVRLVTEQ